MPFVHVSSNVSKASVDVPAAMAALSSAASKALGKPEQYVMVKLDLDQDMLFQTLDAVSLSVVHFLGTALI
jgi:phenylpyruvate tautomerase PptA (4-oxalocrotonate tautomerase family)